MAAINTSNIVLPEKVKRIIHTLTAAGFEAYAVGGCVRDSLLGRTPDDWDITTSAKPEQVKKLFPRTIDTGIRHGTVTVMLGGEGFEVTTYRVDGEYEDARHPREVTFTANLTEDLKRRDFTINAMAYNDSVGLVDVFHGIEDMEHGVIRAVGNPQERFTEDALRLMRAVRFGAQLNYRIEDETGAAICALAPALRQISAERIRVELVKLLSSAHPEHMRVLYETGITRVILPEFDTMMETEQNNPHHCYSVGEHTLAALTYTGEDPVIRLAVLFHDMGKPLSKTTDEAGTDHFHGHARVSDEMARVMLRRLKFDNETIRRVSNLVYYHDCKPLLTQAAVRRAMNRVGSDAFASLLALQRADILAQSEYRREEKLAELQTTEELYRSILANRECVTLKDLAVTGSDLMALGREPGKEIGETLKALLDWVLEHPEDNQKEILLSLARAALK